MQLKRNEILTGLLVLVTVAVLTGILILLGAPGLFKPLVSYKIYMDNAAGIKPMAAINAVITTGLILDRTPFITAWTNGIFW